MAAERKTVRELIEEGLRDTERLISQKQYSLSMIRSRQTLEYIVKNQCRRSNIPDGDLMVMIDELYRKGIISRDSCTSYHKIRILGNKAAHEGDNNAYNANNSYQLLSKEVYSYHSARPARSSSTSGRRPKRRRPRFELADLLKLLIPVLVIILVISIIRLFHPADNAKKMSSSAAETTLAEESSAPESSEAAPETVMIYTTTSALNVRSAPTTDGELLTTLPAGTVLDYVGAHSDQWAIINYNGGQAYVASQYISAAEVPADTTPTDNSAEAEPAV